MTIGSELRPGTVAKQNNTPRASGAKIALRRHMLDAIGRDRAKVLDAFAGDGHMYRTIWHEAAAYTGCDLKFYRDDRRAFVVDNVRLLRCIELEEFNIFDLDAYGSPWEQAIIIATRRRLGPGETIGFVITEGQGLKMKLGGMSKAMAQLVGMNHWLPGLGKAQDDIIHKAVIRLAEMMNAEVIDRREAAGKTGSAMRYMGLILRGRRA